MKVKCEVCGEMVEQKDMSKSYKRRCKKCVAEAARNERKRFKEFENTYVAALNGSAAHIPAGAGAKSAIPVSDNDQLLYIATALMQGMMSNPNLCSPRFITAQDVVNLARNAKQSAKALIRVIKEENQ